MPYNSFSSADVMNGKNPNVIKSIAPYTITDVGGEEIVINGGGFTGATQVYFESVNLEKNDAKSFIVVSDGQIKVVSPHLRYIGASWITVVVDGKNSAVPSVPTLDRDGSGGVNRSSRPGDANRINIESAPEPEDENATNLDFHVQRTLG